MRDKILFVITMLFISAGVWGFYYFFESYEKQLDQGFSLKARTNPYLAAEQFLSNLGYSVTDGRKTIDFQKTPTTDIVIMSRVNSILLTSRQVDEAIEWIRQGGHLIVGVGVESNLSVDSILSRFEVEAKEESYEDNTLWGQTDSDEKLSERLKKENARIKQGLPAETSTRDDKSHHLLTVSFDDHNDELEVFLVDHIFFKHLPGQMRKGRKSALNNMVDYELIASSNNVLGDRLLQFSLNDGLITMLSGIEAWNNHYINKHDNAYFLAELANKSPQIHLQYNIEAPPLYKLLYTHFAEALCFLLLALLLWLYRHSLRTKLIKTKVYGEQRNFSEHFIANCEFLLKQERFMPLVDAIYHDIEQQISIKKPDFRQLSNEEKAKLLAEQTNINQKLIQPWLAKLKSVNNQEDFIYVTQIGKMIREKL